MGTNAEGLQQSLAGMGFIELGLAFLALCCYALALNAALGAHTRTIAAALAALAAAGFSVVTDPWVNGVIFVAIGVAAMGAFVACVWIVTALCGLSVRRPEVLPLPGTEAGDLPAPTSPAPLRPSGPARPIHSA
jgi:hypothetical protein